MSILINDGRDGDDIMKCDIGHLVMSVEKLKTQIAPFIKILANVQSILKWDRPFLSIITMVLICYISLFNPVYLLLLALSPLLPVMVFGLLQSIGTSNIPSKTYKDFFIRKDHEYTQELESQEEKRKHLNMYLILMIELQKKSVEMNKLFDAIYCVLFWKEKKISLMILIMVSLLELSIYVFDVSIVICVLTLAIFLCNKYLFRALLDAFNKMKAYISNVFALKATLKEQLIKDQSFVDSPRKPKDDLPTGDADILDASSSSSSSSEEDDEAVERKMSQGSTKTMVHSESMMSKLFHPRSWRRRTVENCSQCYQPVSSILKKRRYCRHCGKSFCSRCCHVSVPRSFLGATAPAAYQEKVLVCNSCHKFLTNRLNSATEIIE